MDSSSLSRLLSDLAAKMPSHINVEATKGSAEQALILSIDSDKTRYAVVVATGYSWYSLNVNGGFAVVEIDEDAGDERIKEIVSKYVDAAIAYLDGKCRRVHSRILGTTRLEIILPTGVLRLKRPLMQRSGRGL